MVRVLRFPHPALVVGCACLLATAPARADQQCTKQADCDAMNRGPGWWCKAGATSTDPAYCDGGEECNHAKHIDFDVSSNRAPCPRTPMYCDDVGCCEANANGTTCKAANPNATDCNAFGRFQPPYKMHNACHNRKVSSFTTRAAVQTKLSLHMQRSYTRHSPPSRPTPLYLYLCLCLYLSIYPSI